MVDVNELGPDHEYEVAAVALPVSESVVPLHKLVGVALAVIPVMEFSTVTAAVCAMILPHEFVAVNVYIPADKVPAVNAAGFCNVDEKLLGPDHE